MLRSRAGDPVTYGELQAAGIEFPASLISELELAGVEVERCHRARPGERPVRAVRLPLAARALSSPKMAVKAPSPLKTSAKRLRSATDSEVPAAASLGWGEVRVYRGPPRRPSRRPLGAAAREQGRPDRPGELLASRAASLPPRRRPSARVLALLALVGAIAVTAIVITEAVAGGKAQPRLAAQHHPRSPGAHAGRGRARPHATPAPPGTTKGTGTQPRTTSSAQVPRLPSMPVSPALANVLEARGHSALTAGQYSGAVRILERAVAATGESVAACSEPTTENCLTYAFALFDLGRALLLSGHAASAAAVLEQRLQIDNQRPEVAAQLALAREG